MKGSDEEVVAAQARAVQARADAEVLASRADTVGQLLALNATLTGAGNDAAREAITLLIAKLVSPQPPA